VGGVAIESRRVDDPRDWWRAGIVAIAEKVPVETGIEWGRGP